MKSSALSECALVRSLASATAWSCVTGVARRVNVVSSLYGRGRTSIELISVALSNDVRL